MKGERTRRIAWLMALAASVAAGAETTTRVPAPSSGCLDARQIREFHRADGRTLALLDAHGQRFRIDLGECPAPSMGESAQLLAREGWVCGRGDEYLRAGDVLCPVARVLRIDAAAYAALARSAAATADGLKTLDPVQVREARRHGFAGSHGYCFNPRYMRSWSEDPDGLLVEVSPRRSQGHRFYRVQLERRCPGLESSSPVAFRSGLGIGLICGNHGDALVTYSKREMADGIVGGMPGGFDSATDQRPEGIDGRLQSSCPVSAVYPRD